MNKFWNIASTLGDDKVLNVYVYGDIVTDRDFWFGSPDDVVTREFIKDLNNNPNAERINVYINSGGGEVFAAIAMAQQLQKHKAEVHTYVEGIAASAATIIAMAGDVRHMSRSSLYMIHLPSSSIRGNKHAMAKGIEVLEKVEDVIRMTYASKCKISDEQLTELIDHESWLTADEALEYGFIDDVIEDQDKIENLIKDIQNDILNMNGVNINIAAYAEPEKLRQKLTEIQNSSKGGTVMDFQAFLNSLPVDKRKAIEDEMASRLSTGTKELTDQVTTLTEQVTTLTDQVTEAQTSLAETKTALEDAQAKLKEYEDKADQRDADQKFLDSLPEEARAAVMSARQAAADAKAEVAKMQDAAAFESFKAHLSEYGNLPIQDEHVTSLYNMSKACPEDFANIEALIKVADAGMVKQFMQVGRDGDGTDAPTDAYSEIEKKVRDAMSADETLDYNTAFTNVIRENPDLYDQYKQGM